MPARAAATVVCSLLFVGVVLTSARGAETAPDPLVTKLQDRLDHLTSLQGEFVQTLSSSGLGRTRTESGRFWIRKPNLMRWEYTSPEKKLAIVDGTHAWLYLPEEREAQRGPASEVEQAGATSLLTGRLRLDRDFTSRRPGPDELAADLPLPTRTVMIELTPRRGDLEFQKALVAVEPDRLEIRKLVLVDPLGDRMSFTFSGLEQNQPLPDSLFRFDPPPGVHVEDGSDGPG